MNQSRILVVEDNAINQLVAEGIDVLEIGLNHARGA